MEIGQWLISATLGMPLAADILFTSTLLIVLRLSRTETKRSVLVNMLCVSYSYAISQERVSIRPLHDVHRQYG